MEYWAVIPSGKRSEMLGNLVTQLLADDVNVVVVDTGYDPPLESSLGVTVLQDRELPKNISRWWNVGMQYAHDNHEHEQYAIAVLNDDLRLPPQFVRRLARRMWERNAACAYPNQHGNGGPDLLYRVPGRIDLAQRIVGYAFVLDGQRKIFADERLSWWYGDDDIDWIARSHGGSLLVGDLKVQHLSANGWQADDPNLLEQIGQDRVNFKVKWGDTPW